MFVFIIECVMSGSLGDSLHEPAPSLYGSLGDSVHVPTPSWYIWAAMSCVSCFGLKRYNKLDPIPPSFSRLWLFQLPLFNFESLRILFCFGSGGFGTASWSRIRHSFYRFWNQILNQPLFWPVSAQEPHPEGQSLILTKPPISLNGTSTAWEVFPTQ